MESPDNRDDKAPTRYLSLPNGIYKVRNGLHLIELLVKWSHGNLQATQAITKSIGYWSQVYVFISLNREKSSWGRAYHPTDYVHCSSQYSVCCQRINTNPATNTSVYNGNIQDMLVQQCHKGCESNQQNLVRFKAHSTRWNPFLILLAWPRI